MRLAKPLWLLFLALVAAVAVQSLLVVQRRDPEDLPWTPLDLAAPVGLFTGAKLTALAREPGRCRALMTAAGRRYRPVPPRSEGAECGWYDAVRLGDGAAPAATMACPLAASVDLWMARIVQPAAAELLGTRVVRTDHYGSYACRRTYGQDAASGAPMSQHAFANAIDVAGFRLADGRRITIARDWNRGAAGAFLHRIRDGGCRLFATTLSPDYNAAHRDHLHLDQADRGVMGWRMCG